MPATIIYHNPRCSKSRQTLQLLRDNGVDPVIIEYLKKPPDAGKLRELIKMLGVPAIELVRKKEEPFKKLGLDKKQDDARALVEAMAAHPILIERPIVVKGKQARIGRPPEKVLEIL